MLLLVVSACEPYADPVSLDVDPASAHKGRPHGKPPPDDPPPDPEPGPDGLFGIRIGYSSPYNGGPASGVFSSAHSAISPVGSTLEMSGAVTVVSHLQAQFPSEGCFPEQYELGTWSITVDEAEFSFSALSSGGSAKSYVLVLSGGSFPAWPVSEGSNSFFNATHWTLTPQGKNNRKNRGCEVEDPLPLPGGVRVEVGHSAPVIVEPNIVYATGAVRSPTDGEIDLLLDLWKPADVNHPALRPGLILIHGGSFTAQIK